MPRNYVRKTTRGEWHDEEMVAALAAVEDGMPYKTASREFSVPVMSLKRRAKEKNKVAVGTSKYLGGKRTVFTPEQELELIEHIKDMETRMYGLTKKDVMCLAYQLAEANNIEHPFQKEKAGEDWLRGFRQRHPEITLRAPESTSTARARAFNKPVVDKFYSTLKDIQKKKHFASHRIYNVDETSICTVPTKNTKVFARTGRKQVARVTSAERGETTTAVICMSASGTFVPPLFIFRRARMKIELMDGAPPGSIWACNTSGWMNTDVFTMWFDHFLHHVKPSEDDPAMLILDGHLSHTKNLNVVLKARENHVTLICLPPHCTHKLQPLDVSVMYPLSIYHNQSLEKWMNNNPGRAVSVFQITKIFGEAYLKAAVPLNAINGFAKTGICPYNPDVFSDVDYVAAETTEEDLEEQPTEPLQLTVTERESTASSIGTPIEPLQSPSAESMPTDCSDAHSIESPRLPDTEKASTATSICASIEPLQSPSTETVTTDCWIESPKLPIDETVATASSVGTSIEENSVLDVNMESVDAAPIEYEVMGDKTPSPAIAEGLQKWDTSSQPSTSNANNRIRSPCSPSIIDIFKDSQSTFKVSPAVLKPVPKIVGKRSNLKRKRVDITILTRTTKKNY